MILCNISYTFSFFLNPKHLPAFQTAVCHPTSQYIFLFTAAYSHTFPLVVIFPRTLVKWRHYPHRMYSLVKHYSLLSFPSHQPLLPLAIICPLIKRYYLPQRNLFSRESSLISDLSPLTYIYSPRLPLLIIVLPSYLFLHDTISLTVPFTF